MRLPWGDLAAIRSAFLQDDYALLGCLSFEERCASVAIELSSPNCKSVDLLEIKDPEDAWPDYSSEIEEKVSRHRDKLIQAGVAFHHHQLDLLATEDDMIFFIQDWRQRVSCPTVILDITSFPKRFFCLFLKRMLQLKDIKNVIVTYTTAGKSGYTLTHLAEDAMSQDLLPGFAAPPPPKGDTLAIAIGFEVLNISSLMQTFRDKSSRTKVLLAFPSAPVVVRRQIRAYMEMVEGESDLVDRKHIEVLPAWDAELVYHALKRWRRDTNGLTLAPFGPKPHTLGMALFAIQDKAGMYYTQPKSYNPNYSIDAGPIFAYVVKWDEIACFDRPSPEYVE